MLYFEYVITKLSFFILSARLSGDSSLFSTPAAAGDLTGSALPVSGYDAAKSSTICGSVTQCDEDYQATGSETVAVDSRKNQDWYSILEAYSKPGIVC